MRLLVVSPEFPPHAGGGILKFYSVLVEQLAMAGTEVTVLVASPFSAHADYETPAGVRVRFVSLHDVDRHTSRLEHLAAAPLFRRFIGAAGAAAEFLRHHVDEFDVVEATDFGLLFAPIVASGEGPPVIVRMHGSLGQISEHEPVVPGSELAVALSRISESIALPHADRLLAYSPQNATEWQARLGTNVGFEPPPLPLSDITSPAPTDYTGVVAARVQSWKGPEVLCRALASVGNLPADLKIAWVGRDTRTAPGGQSLSTWLHEHYPGIWGTHIVPLGQQSAAAVASLQASARYTIVPSLWDTFNYTIAEAMANACVTIASSGAGASYLIESGVNGIRFNPDDPDQLGRHILDVHLASPSRRREMGAAARSTIARELDPSYVTQQTRACLETLTRRSNGSPLSPWIREFLEPGELHRAEPNAFLENVSIRNLAGHLAGRLTRKFQG